MRRLNIVYKLLLPLFLMIFLVISSCGSGNLMAEGSPEYLAYKERLNDLEFNIENDWASPSRGSRVNLQGNSNYIRFKGDSVAVYLPYFGVRHSGGGYGSEGALVYEGLMEELQVEEHPRKQEADIYFSGSHKGESLDFHVTLYPNGKAVTSVGSSQRDRISYDGRVVE